MYHHGRIADDGYQHELGQPVSILWTGTGWASFTAEAQRTPRKRRGDLRFPRAFLCVSSASSASPRWTHKLRV